MDAAVVERARAGDADAFETIVRGRLDAVHRLAVAIMANEADARDVTQETFLLAWQRLPTLREPARFDAWLHRIALNAARGALRKRGRVREITGLPVRDRAIDGPGGSAQRRILAAFDRLPLEQRALLTLHHLEGRPLEEIAHVLGVPTGTAKSRLFTARAALARALAEDGR